MGTRTYSRRGAGGERVLTAAGRVKFNQATGLMQGSTAPVTSTGASTTAVNDAAIKKGETYMEQVNKILNNQILLGGMEVTIRPTPASGDYRLFDTKQRGGKANARNAVNALHTAAKEAFSSEATNKRLDTYLAALPESVRNDSRVQATIAEMRQLAGEIGDMQNGITIKFSKTANPDVSQIKRMGQLGDLYQRLEMNIATAGATAAGRVLPNASRRMRQIGGSLRGVADTIETLNTKLDVVRNALRSDVRSTRLIYTIARKRAADAIDLQELQHRRGERQDAWANTFRNGDAPRNRNRSGNPAYVIMPPDSF